DENDDGKRAPPTCGVNSAGPSSQPPSAIRPRSRWLWRVPAVVSVLTVASLACAEACTNSHSQAAKQSVSKNELGPPSPSTIEGLPVPTAASLVQRSERGATYVVSGSTLAQVNEWYDGQLASQQPWRDWQPCRINGGVLFSSPGTHRVWKNDGMLLKLFVVHLLRR